MEQMDIDNDSENESIEQMDVDNSEVNINVIAGIYGHGGLSEDIKKPWIFPRLPQNIILNILGFAPAGFCSIVSKGYETEVDKILTNDPSKLTPEFLNAFYIEISKNYRLLSDRYATLVPSKDEQLFTYFKNYGQQTKARTDKMYAGATDAEIKTNMRLDGLTTTGPLLKIYHIVIKDSHGNVLMTDDNVKSITFVKTIFLSKIVEYITNNIRSEVNKFIGSKPYKINIDLFDDTCNYTTTTNIAFLDSPKLKTVNVIKGTIKGGKTRKQRKKGKVLKKSKHRKTKRRNKKRKMI